MTGARYEAGGNGFSSRKWKMLDTPIKLPETDPACRDDYAAFAAARHRFEMHGRVGREFLGTANFRCCSDGVIQGADYRDRAFTTLSHIKVIAVRGQLNANRPKADLYRINNRVVSGADYGDRVLKGVRHIDMFTTGTHSHAVGPLTHLHSRFNSEI